MSEKREWKCEEDWGFVKVKSISYVYSLLSLLIVSPVNTFAYHHYVDFAYESIFIWYLDFIKIFIIENSNIVYLSSSYNIFKGRRRRFWSESENLRYPWGFHNSQKNPSPVSGCPEDPTIFGWKIPKYDQLWGISKYDPK